VVADLPPATAQVLLARHAPVLAYDRRERWPATRVGGRAGDVAYGRAVRQGGRTYLQLWLFSEQNPQDRGIVRTGRHAGDWEVVQLRLDPAGREVDEVAAAQHSWAERCPAARVRRSGGRVVVFVAHASHASYLRPGRTDRPWPDPTDEHPGDGRRVVPRVLPLLDQPWADDPRRFGGARAGWVPGESSSPRGPRFQPEGPDDRPAAWAAGARVCGSGAPPHPPAVRVAMGGTAVAALAAGAVVVVRRRRRA
jgi:hypothetical protein